MSPTAASNRAVLSKQHSLTRARGRSAQRAMDVVAAVSAAIDRTIGESLAAGVARVVEGAASAGDGAVAADVQPPATADVGARLEGNIGTITPLIVGYRNAAIVSPRLQGDGIVAANGNIAEESIRAGIEVRRAARSVGPDFNAGGYRAEDTGLLKVSTPCICASGTHKPERGLTPIGRPILTSQRIHQAGFCVSPSAARVDALILPGIEVASDILTGRLAGSSATDVVSAVAARKGDSNRGVTVSPRIPWRLDTMAARAAATRVDGIGRNRAG